MRKLLLALTLLTACADQTNDAAPVIPPNAEEPTTATSPAEAEAEADAKPASSSSSSPSSASPPPDDDAPPAVDCDKQITAIFTVGVPGLSKIKTNGCWKPLITDGASAKDFRKCSTSTFSVTNNPTAPNWAYDDTNPTHPSAQETSFFNACASGATGDGYVFMAYNSGWRVLTNPSVKAYFAELYTSAPNDIDSHYAVPGVYTGNTTLAKHTQTYPMLNFGPPASANLEKKVGAETAKLCATVKDGGYIGLYNASWQSEMAADDVRLLALEDALNDCTKAP